MSLFYLHAIVNPHAYYTHYLLSWYFYRELLLVVDYDFDPHTPVAAADASLSAQPDFLRGDVPLEWDIAIGARGIRKGCICTFICIDLLVLNILYYKILNKIYSMHKYKYLYLTKHIHIKL